METVWRLNSTSDVPGYKQLIFAQIVLAKIPFVVVIAIVLFLLPPELILHLDFLSIVSVIAIFLRLDDLTRFL